MDKLQADNCVPIFENENWGVLFYVSVRMGARGREPFFLLFFGLVHRSTIQSAALSLLALIILGPIGARLMRIWFF